MSDRSHINQQDYLTAGIRQEAAVEDLQRARLLNRPSAIYRPDIFQDGNAWCALLGSDIAVGVVGWGDSPAAAMAAFDAAWGAVVKTVSPSAIGKPITDASRAAPITTAQQIAFCEREELKEIGLTDLAHAKGLSIIAGFHLELAEMYRSIAAALRPLLTTEDKVPAEDGAEP